MIALVILLVCAMAVVIVASAVKVGADADREAGRDD
jgi:hypothetical protein